MLLALIVAMGGGNAYYTLRATEPDQNAHDRFTGTQGAEVRRQLELLQAQIAVIQSSGPVEVRRHLDALDAKLAECLERHVRENRER